MNIKKLLYESFDRKLKAEESLKLDSALKQSAGLMNEKESISRLREVVSQNGQKEFSPDFEYNLMRRINMPAEKKNYQYIFFDYLSSVFRKTAFAAIIIIVLTLTYNFGRIGNISLQSALGIKQQTTSFADDFKNLFSFYN